MSKGVPQPFRRMMATAVHVEDELRRWSVRTLIAGSLRRRRPFVGDVDLVILPADKPAILSRIRESCTIQSGGDNVTAQNTIATMRNGIVLNIFFARAVDQTDFFEPKPGNWGALALCRTGSRGHNIAICEWAKRRGLHYDPYRGVLQNDRIIASETEEEIYAALNLPFLEPADREDITLDRLQSL